MQTFNPDAPCVIHDQLNNELLPWSSDWATHYREFAQPFDLRILSLGIRCCSMDGIPAYLDSSTKINLSPKRAALYLDGVRLPHKK